MLAQVRTEVYGSHCQPLLDRALLNTTTEHCTTPHHTTTQLPHFTTTPQTTPRHSAYDASSNYSLQDTTVPNHRHAPAQQHTALRCSTGCHTHHTMQNNCTPPPSQPIVVSKASALSTAGTIFPGAATYRGCVRLLLLGQRGILLQIRPPARQRHIHAFKHHPASIALLIRTLPCKGPTKGWLALFCSMARVAS